jgi:hypothetical protein
VKDALLVMWGVGENFVERERWEGGMSMRLSINN